MKVIMDKMLVLPKLNAELFTDEDWNTPYKGELKYGKDIN